LKKKPLSLLFIALLFASVFSVTIPLLTSSVKGVTGNTWTVDDDGQADFHSIQNAINASSNGDTVLVLAGTYLEHVVVNKTLTLVSNESAVIDASGAYESNLTPELANWNGITVISDNTIINGFIVNNAANYGINIRANYCSVYNNTVYDCSVAGIRLYGETEGYSDVTLNNPSYNNITCNNVIYCGSGLFASTAIDNTLFNNTFKNNRFTGIYLSSYSTGNIVDSNLISETTQTWSGEGGYGIAIGTGSNHNIINNNTIANNWNIGCDLDIFGLGYPYAYSNIVYGNRFINNTIQAYDSGENNQWDNGFSGGNYWSDYVGIDTNNDYIGDSPYLISINSTDNYPLFNPYTSVSPPTPTPSSTPTVVPTNTPQEPTPPPAPTNNPPPPTPTPTTTSTPQVTPTPAPIPH